jgi:hypothetical protein
LIKGVRDRRRALGKGAGGLWDSSAGFVIGSINVRGCASEATTPTPLQRKMRGCGQRADLEGHRRERGVFRDRRSGLEGWRGQKGFCWASVKVSDVERLRTGMRLVNKVP